MHHVHAVEWRAERWHAHRAFRDYLRAQSDETGRDGDIEARLAAEVTDSREFHEREQPFVDALFERAWAWYSRDA